MSEQQNLTYEQELKVILFKEIVSLAAFGLMMMALTKRDDITRIKMRIEAIIRRQREHEMQDTIIARFRRQISEWEHAELGR